MTGPDDRNDTFDLGTLAPASARGESASHPASSPAPQPAPSTPGSDDTGRGPSWRGWVALGAAAIIGAAVGVTVDDARDEAAELGAMSIVAGAVLYPVTPSGGLDVYLMNAGPRPVDVVDVSLDGWAHRPDTEDPAVLTAEPGSWLQFNIPVEASCDARPSGTAQVTARTAAGDEVTHDLTLRTQDQENLDLLWEERCQTLWGAGVSLREPNSVASTSGKVSVTIPVVNAAERTSTIVAVESSTPGFVVDSPDLPLDLPHGESVTMTVDWTLEDCAAATGAQGADVEFDFASGDLRRRVPYAFPSDVLIELVRVTLRACDS